MSSALNSFSNGCGPDSVLVAEDDRVFRKLLETWLERWGYKVKVVEDGAAAWRELQYEHHPRLLLLDWMMPGIDGVEICRRIRALQHELYSYILVVTSKQDKQDAITALDAGADDYIVKPINFNELRARMQVGRRVLLLQDELLRSREQLRRQATLDSLTGLLSRRAVIESLREELARSRRSGASLGVLMLDIDKFKQINDRYGHQVGDTVLAEAAGRLAAVLRTYDKVGRYGVEEFLVVLPDCPASLLASIAERIRARVLAKPFVTASAEIAVTVSVGGTISGPGRMLDSESAIRAAGFAMRSAKHKGRNCCVIAPEAILSAQVA
jgi:diguanylate cyclase (GGDEF)-like protein